MLVSSKPKLSSRISVRIVLTLYSGYKHIVYLLVQEVMLLSKMEPTHIAHIAISRHSLSQTVTEINVDVRLNIFTTLNFQSVSLAITHALPARIQLHV